MDFNFGWYVLYVQPRWEKKVFKLLEDNNLEAFLPLVKTVRQWSDRKKILNVPLFPSYVFVSINSSLEFSRVMSLKGVYGFVRFGKEYALIPQKEIERIKVLIGLKGITDIQVKNPNLKIGETMKITSGPLGGLECEVLKNGGKNRIIVKIDSIKQNIIATLPYFYLEHKKASPLLSKKDAGKIK